MIGLVAKRKPTVKIADEQNRYGILISARNEETVIPHLIKSITRQKFPQENLTIFVVADNCTDHTATCALSAGAIVYTRQSTTQIGKGYALDFLIKQIENDYKLDTFKGFFIFDADNLLDEHYIAEMNKLINTGYPILTSYRNSKNYGSNWISAGYALWFLREAKFLNGVRMWLGTGCAISGTGFFVSTKIIQENGGWPFHLLTEDIEFSVYSAIKGNRIGYCETAIFYDEQPETFAQSWKQRMRWTKGFYQVFGKHGLSLIKSMLLERNFFAFDMFMTVLPGMVITAVTMSLNVLIILIGYSSGVDVFPVLRLFVSSLITFYLLLFTVGLVTTTTEWHRIHCPKWLKVLYLFTFPIFMMTYMPIAIVAMFVKVQWKPISHTSTKTLTEIRNITT